MKRSTLSAGSRAEQILTRTVPVKFGDGPDETLNVVISVPKLQKASTALSSGADFGSDEGRALLASALADVVVSWDLVDEDGTEFAATPENLLTFTDVELLVLLTALTEDLSTLGKAATSGSSKRSTKQAKTHRKS